MQHNLHIDWLSITIPVNSGDEIDEIGDIERWQKSLGKIYTCDTSKWRVSAPLFSYTAAYTSSHGTIALYGQARMGIHIIYSGQSLQALALKGIDTERLIENAVRMGAKATRVDIALDMYNTSASMRSFQHALETKRAITASRTWRNMQNSEGGHTLYIGSRTSERMVRVYDKKAERAREYEEIGSDSWIRVEAELKGDRARDFLRACENNQLDDVMLSHLIAAVDFPTISDWKDATVATGKAVEPTMTKRKDTKTRHWLKTIVARTIAREVAQDGEFYAELLTEVNALVEEELRNLGNSVD